MTSPNKHGFLRFVLLCPQRSGSNALSSLLNQFPEIQLYGQLFNNGFEYRRYHRADLDLPLFRAHPDTLKHFGPSPPWSKWIERQALRLVERERSLARYMLAFWSRFPAEGARAVGFKLHDFQVKDTDLTELFDQHLDRIVILSRKNLLKSAVSWAVAMRTGEWVRKGPKATQRPPVRLPIDELAWFIEKTRRSVDDWHRAAEASVTPTLSLTYEDDVLPKAIQPLLRFLNAESRLEVDFETRRLASPRYEHVLNAREIDAALGSPATGYLFDDRTPPHHGAEPSDSAT